MNQVSALPVGWRLGMAPLAAVPVQEPHCGVGTASDGLDVSGRACGDVDQATVDFVRYRVGNVGPARAIPVVSRGVEGLGYVAAVANSSDIVACASDASDGVVVAEPREFHTWSNSCRPSERRGVPPSTAQPQIPQPVRREARRGPIFGQQIPVFCAPLVCDRS